MMDNKNVVSRCLAFPAGAGSLFLFSPLPGNKPTTVEADPNVSNVLSVQLCYRTARER